MTETRREGKRQAEPDRWLKECCPPIHDEAAALNFTILEHAIFLFQWALWNSVEQWVSRYIWVITYYGVGSRLITQYRNGFALIFLGESAHQNKETNLRIYQNKQLYSRHISFGLPNCPWGCSGLSNVLCLEVPNYL